MFDATSNCLLHARNFYVHSDNNPNNAAQLQKKFVDSCEMLEKIARKYNAYIPFVLDERVMTVGQGLYNNTKMCVVFARLVRTWLAQYNEQIRNGRSK